jgi:hypothetical protein
VDLEDAGKRKFLTLRGLELRPICRRARSQSLYRLCHRDSYTSRETPKSEEINSQIKETAPLKFTYQKPIAQEECNVDANRHTAREG